MGESSNEETKVTLLEFPCQFPIKMLGRECNDFRITAVAIVERHSGKISADAIRCAPSSSGNFLSVTVTIEAQSQKQLDDIYQDLTDHDAILVAL